LIKTAIRGREFGEGERERVSACVCVFNLLPVKRRRKKRARMGRDNWIGRWRSEVKGDD
jgi:hypothetical protein